MSRSVVLGLALLAGVSFLLFVWSAPAERAAGEHVAYEGPGQEPAQPSEQELLMPPPAGAPPEPGKDDTHTRPTRSSRERPRISGTVVVPGGFPSGERPRVRGELYSGTASDTPPELTARVAPDGSFSLALPEGTIHVVLRLRSDSLLLRTPVVARPGDTGIELKPEVCAALEGVVVPPLPLSTQGASWERIEVSWSIDPDLARTKLARGSSVSGKARPDEGGGFVLALVPVGVALELHATNPFGPNWSCPLEPLQPGEKRAVEVALELGITISGRVIDEHGQPVQHVRVTLDGEELQGPDSAGRIKYTDAEGRFSFLRQGRRVTRIDAQAPMLARSAKATVDGTGGDVREVVLTVVRGGCIEGVVLWPDRSPAEHFEVSASGPDAHRMGNGRVSTGKFRLCGLTEGSYEVFVHATRDRVAGTARAVDVQTGSAPCELILAETTTFDVRGVVVDGENKPLDLFFVMATRPSPEFRSSTAVGRDGGFELSGLEPGEWTIEANAPGRLLAQQDVLVDGPSGPLHFVLQKAGRIRVRVVDPANDPVPGAWVSEEGGAFAFRFSGPHDLTTDAEGRCEFEASSSHHRLVALKDGFAPSTVVELEVGAGESADVVLRLRKAYRVEGRVLDEFGAPLPKARIHVVGMNFVGAESDAQGAFELQLPPGPFRLTADHPEQPEAHATAESTAGPARTCSLELRFAHATPERGADRTTEQPH